MNKRRFKNLVSKSEFTPKSIVALREGYSWSFLASDLFAGLTVAIVALPLAMAIAIASGLPPQTGLFTAIVAGFFISALGGSRHQIGGPTAAFVVTVANIAATHGYDGLVLATIMAGVMLIFLGIARAGILIKFIPYPVITGFTSGIALLIFVSQIKDFLGLHIESVPTDFVEKIVLYAQTISTINPFSVLIASLSIAVILGCQKFIPKLPGPIVVVVLSSAAVILFGLPVETIESKYHSIPNMLPSPVWPEISFEKIRLLLPSAITIAVLAGIESLLSAVVADGMVGTRHKSNIELIGQGTANIASALFGGIPATGAIARTATNIKSGAKTPFAGIFHAIWLLAFMFLFASFIVMVPLAALSGILMVIAWNMSEIKHIKSILHAPRSDIAVLFITFLLTVLVDLNFAVQVGISIASLLFIKKMMDSTQIRQFMPHENEEDDADAISKKTVPYGVEVYEINGPLFFGVADRLKDTLKLFEKPPIVFILRMRHVPIIDAAGLHALEEFHAGCEKQGTRLILSGVNSSVLSRLVKAGLVQRIGEENIFDHIDKALTRTVNIMASK